MERGKRGLSTIVITLILILLSLVAVGLVWFVVNNVLKSGAEGVELGAKCLNVNVEATAVDCSSATSCEVTLSRTGTETDEIAGVKLVFRDTDAGTSSTVISEAGNIESLVGLIVTENPQEGTGETITTEPNKIEVTVYFLDASGNEQLCAQSNSFEF